jgi:hypothetical protein
MHQDVATVSGVRIDSVISAAITELPGMAKAARTALRIEGGGSIYLRELLKSFDFIGDIGSAVGGLRGLL